MSLKEEIWQWVTAVPPGKVATYGQIARLAGYPGHARYVGTVLKQLPKDSTLPWFRILRSNGALGFPLGSASWHSQKTLLEQEDIRFRNLRVPLRRYQWAL